MAAPIPYVRPARDTSQQTARMSDLIGARTSIDANDVYGRGLIAAQMWGNIGQSFGNAIESGFKAREVQKKEQKIEQKEKDLKAARQMIAAEPADKQADAFRQAGFWEEGDRVEAVQQQRKLAGLQIGRETLAAGHAKAEQAAQIMDSIQNLDPLQRPAAYDRNVEALQALVKGTPYEGQVPTMYREDAAAQMHNAALTMADRYKQGLDLETAKPGIIREAATELLALGPKATEAQREGVFNAIRPELRDGVRAVVGSADYNGLRTLSGQGAETASQLALRRFKELHPNASDQELLEFQYQQTLANANPYSGAGSQPQSVEPQLRQIEEVKRRELEQRQSEADKIATAADAQIAAYADSPGASDETRKDNAAQRAIYQAKKDKAYADLELQKKQIQRQYVKDRDDTFANRVGGRVQPTFGAGGRGAPGAPAVVPASPAAPGPGEEYRRPGSAPSMADLTPVPVTATPGLTPPPATSRTDAAIVGEMATGPTNLSQYAHGPAPTPTPRPGPPAPAAPPLANLIPDIGGGATIQRLLSGGTGEGSAPPPVVPPGPPPIGPEYTGAPATPAAAPPPPVAPAPPPTAARPTPTAIPPEVQQFLASKPAGIYPLENPTTGVTLYLEVDSTGNISETTRAAYEAKLRQQK